MRNLIEYTKGDGDPDFLKLTSLLHWKSDSGGVEQQDLDEIYERLFGTEDRYEPAREPVMDMILDTAQSYVDGGSATDGLEFYSKIVLSIAIRVAAEKFMVGAIGDMAFTDGLGANQSYKLLRRFEQQSEEGREALEVVRSVLLMTPENIHLNSFMYEPIVDMSNDHLKRLYRRVMGLGV